MPIRQNGQKLLVWASDVEPGTIRQAEMAARMEFVPGHVALMPDAHIGIGSTVGSVIPTRGAVIPAAIGVDIGCVDADSEYLSPSGWRKIGTYSGGPVMQYDPFSGAGRFVQPDAYIVKECAEFLSLRTKRGINQMLTADHRILCWKATGRSRSRAMLVISAGDFASEHHRLKQGFKAEFQTTFSPELETKVELSDAQIRVQVMVNADATLNHGAAVLRLVKDRKIVRAQSLLTAAGIDWTGHAHSDGTTTLRFQPPIMQKSYEPFWVSSADQLTVIADECLHWDGNVESRCFYTRTRAEADFIQYVFTACGYRAVLRADSHYRDGKTDYRVFANLNTMVGMSGSPKTEVATVPSDDGLAYCFTVPSGFWVMRRGANVAMTGNCGMSAAKTTLTASDLPDLDDLMLLVSRDIPAGLGKSFTDDRDAKSRRLAEMVLAQDTHAQSIGNPYTDLDQKQKTTAMNQFATLGSGNHFVEISLDQGQHVWAVLHSGSRGIGNQLARFHIDKARKEMRQYFIKLDDPDLAYFVEGTMSFHHYIEDMLWAQRYAMQSRAGMMTALLADLFRLTGKGKVQFTVNCHHNYTEREHHNGKDLWITRKGAIRARTDDLGVIPGSMGTDSYIVRGLANPASYNSAPHGAGRRMSRTQARAQITAEELTADMGSRTWNAGSVHSLRDEAPRAYKDITTVMEDSADLCKIEYKLTAVLNYKGTDEGRVKTKGHQ